MPSDNENRRSRRHTVRPLTSEQAAAIRTLGRKWRDEWRADMAARAGKANGHATELPVPRPPHRTKSAQHAAAQFAIAVARNEFGRFYWSDKLQGAMKESLTGGRRRKNSRKPE
jgi:hypothetical protein